MAFEEYYFLFVLAGIWIVFAVVQDLRKNEIANWLNFSLIGFALAYRAFYSSINDNWMFLVYGLIGFAMFFALAYGFYYGRAFGGGDAKLLMGLGAILPFSSFNDYVFLGLGFIFVLFFIGAIYSFIYSTFIVFKRDNFTRFKREFVTGFRENLVLILLSGGFILFFTLFFKIWLFAILLAFPFLFIYLSAFEKGCMIRLTKPGDLTEGDWLVKEIVVGGRKLEKSVHGLSLEDIRLLRKHGKNVIIRYGIPFSPAFLIVFGIMVYALTVLQFDLEYFLLSLF